MKDTGLIASATFEAGNRTVIVALTEDGTAVLLRALDEHGPDALSDLIEKWLVSRQRHQQAQDVRNLSTDFMRLPSGEQRAVADNFQITVQEIITKRVPETPRVEKITQ